MDRKYVKLLLAVITVIALGCITWVAIIPMWLKVSLSVLSVIDLFAILHTLYNT